MFAYSSSNFIASFSNPFIAWDTIKGLSLIFCIHVNHQGSKSRNNKHFFNYTICSNRSKSHYNFLFAVMATFKFYFKSLTSITSLPSIYMEAFWNVGVGVGMTRCTATCHLLLSST